MPRVSWNFGVDNREIFLWFVGSFFYLLVCSRAEGREFLLKLLILPGSRLWAFYSDSRNFLRKCDHAIDNIYVDSFYLLDESNKIVDENVIGNCSQKYRNYRSNKEGSWPNSQAASDRRLTRPRVPKMTMPVIRLFFSSFLFLLAVDQEHNEIASARNCTF